MIGQPLATDAMGRLRILAINLAVLAGLLVSAELLAGYITALDGRGWPRLVVLAGRLRGGGSPPGGSGALVAEIRRLRANGVVAYPAYRHDPQMHGPESPWFHTYLPGSTVVLCDEGSGVIHFQADGLGFRPTPGHRPAEPWRQLLVGDSFSEGWCVADRHTLAAQLQQRLGNTLNAGRSGSGPLAQLALLQELASSRRSRRHINGDTVVVWQLFSGNDLHNLREEKTTRLADALTEPGEGWFDQPQRWQPALRQFLDNLTAEALAPGGPGESRHQPGDHGGGETLTPARASGDLALHRQVFHRFVSTVRGLGARPVVVLLADHPSYPSALMGPWQDQLRLLCRRAGVPLVEIDLARGPLAAHLRGHLDEQGYALVADQLAAAIGNLRRLPLRRLEAAGPPAESPAGAPDRRATP
ncbi:MAG: hypothetical protein VKN13_06340 [Cyanobacteriota bacterium]|nr:hypothetical protein [Cyanobacteriota bacterium]